MGRFSQAVAEGDGISILVEVTDAQAALAAEREGADGLAARVGASAVRASSQLPLLHLGSIAGAREASADAVVVDPERGQWDEAQALGLECVVRVDAADQLEEALESLDPEMFLLAIDPDSDDDPLEILLELLHDVPAGKLAIAELHDASPEEVAELERSGVDAVLVAPGDLETLVPAAPPEV